MEEKRRLGHGIDSMHLTKNISLWSDEAIMKEFITSKEHKMYTVLYKRYFEEVCRYIAWLNRDKEAAKDIAQKIFIKIMDKPTLFDWKKSFKVWLFSIAKNAWKNEVRAQSIRLAYQKEIHENEVVEEVNYSVVDSDDVKLKKIWQSLDHLSVEHKEVFVLKYANNLTLNEISEICDCSVGTVKSRLFYAVKNIRTLVKK